jgi:hypothetical protein
MAARRHWLSDRTEGRDGQPRSSLVAPRSIADENVPRRTEKNTDSLDDVLAGRPTPNQSSASETEDPDTADNKRPLRRGRQPPGRSSSPRPARPGSAPGAGLIKPYTPRPPLFFIASPDTRHPSLERWTNVRHRVCLLAGIKRQQRRPTIELQNSAVQSTHRWDQPPRTGRAQRCPPAAQWRAR